MTSATVERLDSADKDGDVLYQAYQLQEDLVAPWRSLASMSLAWTDPVRWGLPASFSTPLSRMTAASLEMLTRMQVTHERPDFGITSVEVAGEQVEVTEEVALSLPFGDLVHFEKDADDRGPKVLVIAALSGHFATLLTDTVATLLTDHDVYITDWRNARDIPLSAGDFGVDDYVTYIIEFLEVVGEGTHVVAVCQPCVQALVAVSAMAAAGHEATPASLTLMAGPIDPRVNPTAVNDLAEQTPVGDFEKRMIHTVPARFAGGGRRVYPGFLQLLAFVSMNPKRHISQHREMFGFLSRGDFEEADLIKRFYDEYFAVLDMTAEFYLETLQRVFVRPELALGEWVYKGETIDPAAITNTPLFTVEGERDDICSVGQTAAAHGLCTSLPDKDKQHYLQADAGHYGVFSGRRWRNEIYPRIRDFIASAS